jgi:hypothetical protein
MGEVYRARDLTMAGDVVIKISAERCSDCFSREVHAGGRAESSQHFAISTTSDPFTW